MGTTTSKLQLRQEAVPVVRPELAMKRRALEFNLKRYGERLKAFERQYGLGSQEFEAKFGSGELGDEAAWFEWQYVLDAYQETVQQLQLLESVEW